MVRIRPEATADINTQAEYYDSREPGLGTRFVFAAMAAIDRILPMPEKYRKRYGDVRLVLVRRFPFAVAFTLEGKAKVVLAVIDLRRDPARISATLSARLKQT
jgi:plasmid stabilization system protein ParE